MAAFRTFCLALAGCLTLAACDREPTFDASSLPAYRQSLQAIQARLSVADQHKLQIALLTLAAGPSADYTAFAKANPSTIADIEALDGVPNPLMLLDRMRPGIEGKTAAAVIRRVAADIDVELSRAEGQTDASGASLGAFVIEHARFYRERGFSRVQFSIYNGSRLAVSNIYVSGTLKVPGLAVPIGLGNLAYRFATGLQPGVQEQVTIAIGNLGPWTNKQLEGAYDADLVLKVANADDTNGKRLLAISADTVDTLRRKRAELRGS